MKLPDLAFRSIAALVISISISVIFSNHPAAAHSPHSTPPTKRINVKTYGAKGDGSTDDTAAINKAISVARAGDVIYFPTGNYLHSTHLLFKSISVLGDGPTKSLLTATTSADGALEFLGEVVAIDQIGVQYANPVNSTAILANGIFFDNVKVFAVRNVAVQNVSANGISVEGSILGTIGSSTISSPTETGVFLMNSKEILVSKNTFPLTSTAVYVNNSKISHTVAQNIVIDSNLIQNSSEATLTAAIYVVGVSHCSINKNSVSNNAVGGILVQGNSLAELGNADYVSVTGNTFSNCGLLGNICIQAALGPAPVGPPVGPNPPVGTTPPVSAGKATVQQITVSGNIMKTNNPTFGIIALGISPGTISGLTIKDNDVENVPNAVGIYVDNAANVSINDNTVNQTGLGSIYSGPSNSGSCVINSNKLQACGANSGGLFPSSHDAVIDLEPTSAGGTHLVSVKIEKNTYSSGSSTNTVGAGSPPSGPTDFIFDGAPAHLLKVDDVSGDTSTPPLPIVVTP